MSEHLSILNYSDFRPFLKDYLRDIKKRNSRFSCGAWSRRLGLKTPSALTMILNGQRNPGPELVELIIRDLKLVGREATFFRELVILRKSKGEGSKKFLNELKLAEIHPRKEFRGINLNTFKAISNWHFYAIRELVDLPNFKEDMAWIQKRIRFPLTSKQIQEAIRIMLELGFLSRTQNGKLQYTNQIETGSDFPDEGLKKYHEQILEMAQKSLNTVKPELREISGMSFTLNKKDLARAKEILRQAQYDLSELGKIPGDEVYHVEVALFPLTKQEHL